MDRLALEAVIELAERGALCESPGLFAEDKHPRGPGGQFKVAEVRAALGTLMQQHDHLLDNQIPSLARAVTDHVGKVKTPAAIIRRLDPNTAGSFSRGYNRADMLSQFDHERVGHAMEVLRRHVA